MMTVTDFAKYVVDNMNRATLANALNIPNKFIPDNTGNSVYDINEFMTCIDNYVRTALINSKINEMIVYKILVATDTCRKKLESEVKYNKLMVIDNLIMSIWEAVNGY